MLSITKYEIEKMNPCQSRWDHFLTMPDLPEDGPIGFDRIINHSGIKDALWVLYRMKLQPEAQTAIRRFSLNCARRVEHLTTDTRVKACNDATEKFFAGEISEDDLISAAHAADAAAHAAHATYAAAHAAYAASHAAYDARAAAHAAYDTYAARAAAHAARAAAADAEEKQKADLISLVEAL